MTAPRHGALHLNRRDNYNMYNELYAPLPDVWRYLDRIGVDAAPELSPAGLSSLVREHHLAVPFENYAVCEEKIRPVSLAVADLFEKVVVRSRGGYCFELNALFRSLLLALGFDARPLLCRIMGPGRDHPLPLHRATAVYFGDERYFVDVGFGGQMPEGAVPFGGAPVSAYGSTFRIAPAGGRALDLLRLDGDAFVPAVRFSQDPVDEVDFLPANYFCSASPESNFVLHRMANICRPDGFARIMDDTFTLRTASGDETRRSSSPAEERALLREFFGIELP